MRCPCRKISETRAYADCCGRFHAGLATPSAELLMRSRYAAYALKNASYLTDTWHPATRPARIDFSPAEDWVQLRVLKRQQTGDSATIEFIARSRIGGRTHVLHETSRFVREGGRWFYVDGIVA